MFTGFTNKIKTAIARIKGRTDLVICAVCVAVVVAVLCVSVSLIVKYNSKISDLEKSVSNLEQERNNFHFLALNCFSGKMGIRLSVCPLYSKSVKRNQTRSQVGKQSRNFSAPSIERNLC